MGFKEPVQSYVLPEQKERWLKEADEMGMSLSEFVVAMVEAGLKKFSREVEPDETRDELRQDRNELHEELREARERISQLEKERMASERGDIIEFVEENPGCEYKDIADHLAQTASSRATRVLENIEGEEVAVDENGRWFMR